MKGILGAMDQTCGFAIDLEDAKQMCFRQFQLFRQGEISDDRPTTPRAFLEYISQRQRRSLDEVRSSNGQEKLEQLCRRYPFWRDYRGLDLFCDQQPSGKFFSIEFRDPYVRVKFIDETEYTFDVRGVHEHVFRHLSRGADTTVDVCAARRRPYRRGWGQARVVHNHREGISSEQDREGDEAHHTLVGRVVEKLEQWYPTLPHGAVVGVAKSLSFEQKNTFFTRPEAVKREISKAICGTSRDSRSPSLRDIVDVICDAVDRAMLDADSNRS